MRDFVNGLLEVEAYLDVVLLAELVELVDRLELLREFLLLLLHILEGIHLLNVDIQTSWQLVEDLTSLCKFLSQRLGLSFHCVRHVATNGVYDLLRQFCQVLLET